MQKEIILEDFSKTFSALENVIQLFDNEKFNEIPFQDSWTAAQVVQHIILSSESFTSVLNGNTEETVRPIDKLIPTLKAIFLNFETKMKSPDFILPTIKKYDRDEQLRKIKTIASDILDAIGKLELAKTCLDFQLPTLGVMTRLEAIYFVIFHTQRHTHQLHEISRFMKLP